MEPLLKDLDTFDLSIKDKFCEPYRIMTIQYNFTSERGQPLYMYNSEITPKVASPRVVTVYLRISNSTLESFSDFSNYNIAKWS